LIHFYKRARLKMADHRTKYFCHQCNTEKETVTDEFTCPDCSTGFIEEVHQSDESEDGEPPELMDVQGVLSGLLPGLGAGLGMEGSRPGRYHVYRQGPLRPMTRGAGAPGPHNIDRQLEHFLQELIFNVTGIGVAGGGGGGGAMGPSGLSFHFVPGNQGFQISGDPGIQIHGNPGDYAWGRGGLDAIITQLLNQMDGAGPPPMAQENIKEIPTVRVDAVLLEKNPNCSVCWDDFKLEENVKQLECQHCFHKDCIVPWLELHGTCPVCRKVLSSEGEDGNTTQESEGMDDTQSRQDEERPESSELGTGITGFINNVYNSLLGGSRAGASGYTPGADLERSSQASSTAPGPQQSRPSQSTSTSGSTTRPTRTGSASATAGSDDDTPASRRQRLDSDLLDFDLE